MPVFYKINDDILEIIQIGLYTTDDFLGAWQSAIKDPEFRPPMKVLIDGRMAYVNPSTREIEERAKFLGRIRENFFPCWAYLARPNTLIYGLARMASAFMDSHDVTMEVFSDQGQARRWLTKSSPTHCTV